MSELNLKHEAKRYGCAVLAAMIMALNIKTFVRAGGLFPGGFTGLTLLIQNIFQTFVGIAVPHLIKSLMKTAKPILVIPGCFLGGAVFCLFCDLIARTVFAPTELSISSVTAVFGAPIVIYMMVRKQR